MANNLRARVGRDSARTFVTGILAGVFAIVTGIIIANAFGPAGKGTYSGVQLLYGGLLSFVGGIGSALTFYLTKGKRPLRALCPSLARIFLALCFLLWAGLLAWIRLRGASVATLAMIAAVPPCILISWQPSIFISFDRIRFLNVQNMAIAIITFVGAAFSVLVLRSSITGPIVAWEVGLYFIAATMLVFVVHVLKKEPHEVVLVKDKDLLNFSFRASLNSVVSFLNARIDSILVISFIGIAGFGIYSMATGIAEILYSLSQAFATSISRSIGVSEFNTSALVTAKAIRLNTIVVGIVSLVIFLAAPLLIDKVYGKAFDPAAVPLRILLLGLVVFSSTRILNSFFTYQLGRPMFSVYLMVAVTIIQAIGCIALIPKLGLAGAAIASTLAYLISTLGQMWYFCKITGVATKALWMLRREDVTQMLEVLTSTARTALNWR